MPDPIRWALKRDWPLPEGRDLKLKRDSVWGRFSIAGGDYMARYSGGLCELKVASSCQPASKPGPQSSNARNWILPQPHELEEDPHASDENAASQHTDFDIMRPWAKSWARPGQHRTGPTELWTNKQVLFEASKFVVIGNTAEKTNPSFLSICVLLMAPFLKCFFVWLSSFLSLVPP